MWHAIYDAATGALISLGTVCAATLPEGLASVEVGEARPLGEWNPLTRAFEVQAESITWSPQDFMGRFTVAEETAIRHRAMTDASMVTFLARVERARSVTNTHPDTIAGINYCVALGDITAARAQEILHG